MADTVKSSDQLRITATFDDGDDRNIYIDEPRPNLQWSAIEALDSLAAGVLIGDRYGSTFVRFHKATYIEKTITDIDLT